MPLVALQMSPPTKAILNLAQVENKGKSNVLILVFDTLSALNTSIDGYGRQTTPNLSRFAASANVYHNHYAGGNFTTPGTASLLTGTYPWTNRAIHLHGTVANQFVDKNIFSVFDESYYKVAYTHNTLVFDLLHQFRSNIEELKKIQELCISYPHYSDRIYQDDYIIASISERHTRQGNTIPGSLSLTFFDKLMGAMTRDTIEKEFGSLFPRGIPNQSLGHYFLLEDVFDWLVAELPKLPQPFLVYIHVFPPHNPYNARQDFVDIFAEDGLQISQKPEHFASDNRSYAFLYNNRQLYDEFLAYTDAEFGRFYSQFQNMNLLDNTITVVTSDHGESFERGIIGHNTPALYEPLVRVPLLIKRPGQVNKLDVRTLTNCVDVMPTLLVETDHTIPSWCEGEILPGFGDNTAAEDRAVYTIEAKSNPKLAPLDKATIAMVKGDYKLINNRGYGDDVQPYELYNLAQDPEELEDLFGIEKDMGDAMREELDLVLAERDRVRG